MKISADMYHGGMQLGVLSCNHTIPNITPQTDFMMAVIDKNLLLASCSDAELHLNPLADIMCVSCLGAAPRHNIAVSAILNVWVR